MDKKSDSTKEAQGQARDDSRGEVRVVLDAVRQIVKALRDSSRAAEQTLGVTGAQLFVLQQLDGELALSLNDLAARTHTHQSTVSVVVSRLVERGLVARAHAKDDGRRVALRLTRAGKALLGRAPEAAQETLIAGIERLAPGKRHALAEGLTELVAEMKLPADGPSMFFEDEAAADKPPLRRAQRIEKRQPQSAGRKRTATRAKRTQAKVRATKQAP